jgi:hypothetical protein
MSRLTPSSKHSSQVVHAIAWMHGQLVRSFRKVHCHSYLLPINSVVDIGPTHCPKIKHKTSKKNPKRKHPKEKLAVQTIFLVRTSTYDSEHRARKIWCSSLATKPLRFAPEGSNFVRRSALLSWVLTYEVCHSSLAAHSRTKW